MNFKRSRVDKGRTGFSVALAEALEGGLKCLLNMLKAFVYEALHREGLFLCDWK